MRPSEVDVALVYDGFTFNAISWLEGLGFCGFGEAFDWLDDGRRIALDGELPVNPHGGQLSEGRSHGFGFLYEAVTQLRHKAGERQVAGARTAVVTSGGGTPSGVLLLAAEGLRENGARSDDDTGQRAEKPSGPRSRKGVETRARLLAAAKEVFEQDGFLDARISDIAERAGLSHGSFYHYFESKEEVFREVAAEVEQRLSEPLYSVILDAEFDRVAVRADPRGYPAELRELSGRGPHHGCDRTGLALRRRPARLPQRTPPRLIGTDRRLHTPPAAARARGQEPRPRHCRGGTGGHDLPLPRNVVRAGPA